MCVCQVDYQSKFKKYALVPGYSVTRQISPNVYKSCTKNDFTRKMVDFGTITKIA